MNLSNSFKSVFVFFVFVLAGCTVVREIVYVDPPPPTPSDAGRPSAADAGDLSGDAGQPLPTVDAGPIILDAGSPIPSTILTVIFDGPAPGNLMRGQQDAPMYGFTLIAYEAVQIRNLGFSLEGLETGSYVRGSAGTEYFRDLKLKDLDTGATLMGPISMPPGSPASSNSGVFLFTESFAMAAGETRHLMVTMDIANTEDVRGEFFSGDHSYRVSVANGSERFFAGDSVRRIVDGIFVAPGAIENNVRVLGNALTIVDAELTVSMAASPFSMFGVSHEPNTPSVGLVFTASEISDAYIRSVRLIGMGNVGDGFRSDALNDVVVSCALFNGPIQVGLAQTPSESGVMRIPSINLRIPAGSSVTLVAHCTADSVVAQDTGDRYALGVRDTFDIEAENDFGSSIFTQVATSLEVNTSYAPLNIVTVMRHAAVTVEANNLRQSTILVAGDVWQNMAQVRVTARYEAVLLEALRVTSEGDAASFSAVAIASDGAVLGTGILPAGTNSERDITLTTPRVIERDSTRTYQLWARLAPVVAGGLPRSGSRVRLGLAAGDVSGIWDSSYAGSLNVRFRGVASGDRPQAAGTEILGNEFVVRRSKPTMTRIPLPTILVNGVDQALYEFRMTADPAGPVTVLGFRFNFEKPITATLSDIGFRRGSVNIPVTIVQDRTWVAIRFLNEETILAGDSVVYTIHGTLDGFAARQAFSLSPARSLTDVAMTGYPAFTLAGISLDTGTAIFGVGLLWSDMWGLPHSDEPRAFGGSFDWTGDTFLEDLTSTQFRFR